MSIQYRQFYTILASCIHKKGLQILLCNPFEYDYNFYELCDKNPLIDVTNKAWFDAADMYGDGKLDILDATALQIYIA